MELYKQIPDSAKNAADSIGAYLPRAIAGVDSRMNPYGGGAL